jgi:hypothetical protein
MTQPSEEILLDLVPKKGLGPDGVLFSLWDSINRYFTILYKKPLDTPSYPSAPRFTPVYPEK